MTRIHHPNMTEIEALDDDYHQATRHGRTWILSTAESYLQVSRDYTHQTVEGWMTCPETLELLEELPLSGDLEPLETVIADAPIGGLYLHPLLSPHFLAWCDPAAVISAALVIQENQLYQRGLRMGYCELERYQARMQTRRPDRVTLWHYGLTDPDRYHYWTAILSHHRLEAYGQSVLRQYPGATLVGCVCSTAARQLWSRYLTRHRARLELNVTQRQWTPRPGYAIAQMIGDLVRTECVTE